MTINVSKTEKIIIVGLLIATVFASIGKILIGYDSDEGYVLAMGARMIQGDRLFDNMWELAQTNMIPAIIPIAIFKRVTGSFAGVAIFLRVLSTIFQFGIAYCMYCVLRRKYRFAAYAAIFAANILPRATQNFEYGYQSLIWMILFASITYYLYENDLNNCKKRFLIIVAAISYSISIMVYPTMLVSVLFILVFIVRDICEKKEDCRDYYLFIAICIITAASFFTYLFSYLTPNAFLQNLRLILQDNSHQNNGKLAMLFGWNENLEKYEQAIAIIAASVLGSFFSLWIFKKKVYIVVFVMAVSSIALMILNVTGIRPTGPFGFQIRYVLVAFSGASAVYKTKDTFLKRLWLLGGGVFTGALLGSNRGMPENAAFLYLSLISVILAVGKLIAEFEKKEKILGQVAVVLLVMSVIFIKGFTVRIEGTGPANIMENRCRIQGGPLQGIWVYSSYEDKYDSIRSELEKNIEDKEQVLYIGKDPIVNLILDDEHFVSTNVTSTPSFDEQWVSYFKMKEEKTPDLIVIDKEFEDLWGTFYETYPLGRYFQTIFPERILIEENQYIKIYRVTPKYVMQDD